MAATTQGLRATFNTVADNQAFVTGIPGKKIQPLFLHVSGDSDNEVVVHYGTSATATNVIGSGFFAANGGFVLPLDGNVNDGEPGEGITVDQKAIGNVVVEIQYIVKTI